tara:strand:- start:181 stop:741 length:561 start_codon:yes stop_codon:yes gene_type:complete
MTNYKQTTIMIVYVGLIAIFAVGCNENISQQYEESLPQISTTGRIIKIDDLLNSSFKKSKQYATDGLPGAETVIYGFLKKDSDAFDYEVRFYRNHQQAVDLGVALAEEGSGLTAVLNKKEAVYKEGIKERRMVIGGVGGAGGRSGIGPRYGGYVVYENLILLCPGANLGQAVDRCKYLVIALKPND